MKPIRCVVVEDNDGDQIAAGIGIDPGDLETFFVDAKPQAPVARAIDRVCSDEFFSSPSIA
ncbi:hypothetical protein ACQY1F_16815 [Agrobacterium vitis]|uniref:hypothetical protein n=1 Tax=Agrobacterium vitis TaxID=373 RepID=UPI003D2A923E